jgi:DNA-binding HxlR family transcriptional regulator
LVRREAYATVPVTVEYSLTPLGQSLADAVHTLRTWAYAHMDEIDAAREEFAARPAADGPPTPVAVAH